MFIATSMYGIAINYKCYWLRKPFQKKCPDENTVKCFTCKFCRAEIPAKDVQRLLAKYEKSMER